MGGNVKQMMSDMNPDVCHSSHPRQSIATSVHSSGTQDTGIRG